PRLPPRAPPPATTRPFPRVGSANAPPAVTLALLFTRQRLGDPTPPRPLRLRLAQTPPSTCLAPAERLDLVCLCLGQGADLRRLLQRALVLRLALVGLDGDAHF